MQTEGSSSTGGTGYAQVTSSTVNIGRRSNGTLYLDGKLDDVRLYRYALSKDEISAIYNNGNGTESESYNKLTVDHVDLRDKFIVPYKHMDSLYQVKTWKLAEDSIVNREMRSLVLRGEFEEGIGLYSKLKNIYGNYSADQVDTAQPTRWTTDTYSALQKNAIY